MKAFCSVVNQALLVFFGTPSGRCNRNFKRKMNEIRTYMEQCQNQDISCSQANTYRFIGGKLNDDFTS